MHAQTVCTRPLLGGEGPGDEAKSRLVDAFTAYTNNVLQAEHHVVACLDLPEQLFNCQYCFKVVVALDSLLHNVIDQKKYRNKKRKIKGDLGSVCQKVHKQGRIKVMVNIQSLIHLLTLF